MQRFSSSFFQCNYEIRLHWMKTTFSKTKIDIKSSIETCYKTNLIYQKEEFVKIYNVCYHFPKKIINLLLIWLLYGFSLWIINKNNNSNNLLVISENSIIIYRAHSWDIITSDAAGCSVSKPSLSFIRVTMRCFNVVEEDHFAYIYIVYTYLTM